jgi:hypothetical protein
VNGKDQLIREAPADKVIAKAIIAIRMFSSEKMLNFISEQMLGFGRGPPHSHPSSTWHLLLQPSPSIRFPSSQYSSELLNLIPSPQISVQAS